LDADVLENHVPGGDTVSEQFLEVATIGAVNRRKEEAEKGSRVNAWPLLLIYEVPLSIGLAITS
jgi:hypothetical protein